MAFKFSQEDVKKAEEGGIFNNGVPGRVKNVSVTIEKLGKDYESDSPNAPKYRIIFTDSQGRKTNRAIFGIEKQDYPDQWNRTYEDTVEKEWKYLAKIAEHTGGDIPMEFEDANDLFDKMYTSGIGTDKVNVFANYGTKRSPKERIEVRKWLPAVEPADTPDSDTKLTPSNIESMKALEPDNEEIAASEVDLF